MRKQTNLNTIIKTRLKNFKGKDLAILIFILSLVVLTLMTSPLNILRNASAYTDSSVFRLMGMLMSKGYMPYLNFFDHKGPLLYLINFVGFILGKQSGVWFIEIIFLFICYLFIYKTAKLQTKNIYALLVLLFTTINLFQYLEGGNLTEEYALPFIVISLYIFIDYLLNDKVSKTRIIICGFCFACVCLLRVNMISCWIIFCFTILLKLIKEKDYKKLISYIINFSIGCLIVLIPIFLWLICNGAFKDFIKDYILFNFKYSNVAQKVNKINVFFQFLNNTIVMLAILINGYAIIKEEKKLIYIANFAFILLTLVLITLSGKGFLHYGMTLIPTFVIPFIYGINTLFNFRNTDISVMIIIYLLSNLVIPVYIATVQNDILPFINTKKGNNVSGIVDIIKKNSQKNDKITIYGNFDAIYYEADRLPISKYSYQFPIGVVNPFLMDDYFAELNANNPKLVVIQTGYDDERMKEFIANHNYKQLNYKSAEIAKVYKLKNN